MEGSKAAIGWATVLTVEGCCVCAALDTMGWLVCACKLVRDREGRPRRVEGAVEAATALVGCLLLALALGMLIATE